MEAIPKDVAWRICVQIREQNRNKWYSPARWQCWGCVKFSKGVQEKMCLSSKPGYRGCNLVNGRYARRVKEEC